MLQGAARRIQRVHPLNATSITSVSEASQVISNVSLEGKRNNRSFPNSVPALWASCCLEPPDGVHAHLTCCEFSLPSLRFLSC